MAEQQPKGMHQWAQAIWQHGVDVIPQNRLRDWLHWRLWRIGDFATTYRKTDHELKAGMEAVIIRKVWDRLLTERQGKYGLFIDPSRFKEGIINTDHAIVETQTESSFIPIEDFNDGSNDPFTVLHGAWVDTWNRAIIRETDHLESLSQKKRSELTKEERRDAKTYQTYKKVVHWLNRHRGNEEDQVSPQKHLLKGANTAGLIMTHFFKMTPQAMARARIAPNIPDTIGILQNSYPLVVKVARHFDLFTGVMSRLRSRGLPQLELENAALGPRLRFSEDLDQAHHMLFFDFMSRGETLPKGEGCPALAHFNDGTENVIRQMWDHSMPIVAEIYEQQYPSM